jgi:signal peptidase I
MTALRRGLDLVLAALVLAVLVVGLAAVLAPAGGGRVLAIRSGSMAPSMEVGALAVVMPAQAATLGAGDVVTVSLEGGGMLTHRIDGVVEQDDRRMFRLKGDANAAADPVLVVPGQLVGKVVLTVPWLGYLLAMMSVPIGVLALLSIGGLLVTGGWLLDDLADPDDDDGDEVDADESTVDWVPVEHDRRAPMTGR